jgi:hypothetical protein
MRPTTSGSAFAAASAAMVRGVDGASTVHVLLSDCIELLGAHSAGVLVRVGEQELELLAATSHKAIELELYQSQVHSGPCVESIENGRRVAAAGSEEILAQWPDFGRAMSAAAFQTVHASPMRWHGRVLGGLNMFWQSAKDLTPEESELAQAFADVCTLALMQPSTDDPTAVAERLRSALQGRVVIERAKGVLAQTEGVGVDEAFTRLVDQSKRTAQPLAVVAAQVISDIVTQRP